MLISLVKIEKDGVIIKHDNDNDRRARVSHLQELLPFLAPSPNSSPYVLIPLDPQTPGIHIPTPLYTPFPMCINLPKQAQPIPSNPLSNSRITPPPSHPDITACPNVTENPKNPPTQNTAP